MYPVRSTFGLIEATIVRRRVYRCKPFVSQKANGAPGETPSQFAGGKLAGQAAFASICLPFFAVFALMAMRRGFSSSGTSRTRSM